jgi:hypothetical protein
VRLDHLLSRETEGQSMDWTSSLASGGETTGTRSVSYHSSVAEERTNLINNNR